MLKFARNSASFLLVFFAFGCLQAWYRDQDIWRPGGPAAAFVMALLLMIPVLLIVALVRWARRHRGTGSAVG